MFYLELRYHKMEYISIKPYTWDIVNELYFNFHIIRISELQNNSYSSDKTIFTFKFGGN